MKPIFSGLFSPTNSSVQAQRMQLFAKEITLSKEALELWQTYTGLAGSPQTFRLTYMNQRLWLDVYFTSFRLEFFPLVIHQTKYE